MSYFKLYIEVYNTCYILNVYYSYLLYNLNTCLKETELLKLFRY